MPKTHPTERALLLLELEKVERQELSPDQQLLESFLACPDAVKASQSFRSVAGRHTHVQRPLHPPSTLLPWLG